MTQQELLDALLNRYPHKRISVGHYLHNGEVGLPSGYMTVAVAPPEPIDNSNAGTAHEYWYAGRHASIDELYAALDKQLVWWKERKVLESLTPKEKKLRQALALVLSSSATSEKVKERATKLMGMTDMGLFMMLQQLGVKITTIQNIINSQ